MTINALIPLSGRRVSLTDAFTSGRQEKERREDRKRRQELEDEAIERARKEAADEAKRLAEFESIYRGVKKLTPLLPRSAQEVPRFIGALDERIAEVESTGGDARDTREIRELAVAGNFQEIARQFNRVTQLGEQMQARGLGLEPVQRRQDPAAAAPKVIGNRLVSATGEVLFEGEPGEEMERDRNGVLRFSTGPRRGQIVPGFDVEKELTPEQEQKQQERQQKVEQRQTDRQQVSDIASSLLTNFDTTKRVYGAVQGRTPSVRQATIDAEADVDQLIALLSLGNREKMKGSGQISDFESRLLGQSATVLGNKLISDNRSKRELKQIQRVFNGEVTEAPQAALQALQENPELADQFLDHYGYLPQGF